MVPLRSAFTSVLVSAILVSSAPLPLQARTSLQSAKEFLAFEGGETPSGNFLAAIIAGSAQDIGPAARYYAEALKSDPKDKDILDRALLTSLADGNMSEAFRFSERMLARDPKNPLPNLALAVRALKQHQFAKARSSVSRSAGKLLNLDPLSALLTAWTYVGEGQSNKGIEFADKLGNPGALDMRNFMTALMADISGKSAEALKRMSAVYQADKNNITGVESYARMEARLGDKAVAQKVLEDVLVIAPNDPQITVPLSELKADKIPEPLVKSAVEGAAQVFYFQAGTRAKPGEEILILIYMQFAKYLSPDDDRIEFSLGEAFASLNQHERAISYFNNVDEKSIFYRRAMIRKAFSLESLDRGDEAIVTLSKLTDIQKNDLESLNSLGIMLRVKKHWQEAITAYTKAIEQAGKPTPPYWSLYHGRGICYERNKEWQKAEADLKIALDLLPDDPKLGPVNAYNRAQVLNYLGYSWVDQGLHLDEAFPMLKRAVQLTGERDGYIIDSLGWAYFRQNQFDKAVSELERASQIKPSDPVVNDHLGDAYWRVGRKLEAEFQWNHARDLKPEPEDLIRILKKIEHGLDDYKSSLSMDAPVVQKPNGG